ncbi:IS5/IS1182 family transposase, partial [Staphylococcus edaphicus]
QNQTPSYKTINRFRVNPKTDALLASLFIQFHSQCLEQSLIDDTKVEANANKYTFVWKRNIQNYETKMNENSTLLYQELVKNKIVPEIKEDRDINLTQEEIDLIGTHLDKEIEDLTNQMNESKNVETRRIKRKTRTEIKKCRKRIGEYSERKNKYRYQQSILKDRNSYSKTDHDATFMRMKDD